MRTSQLWQSHPIAQELKGAPQVGSFRAALCREDDRQNDRMMVLTVTRIEKRELVCSKSIY